MGLVSVKDSVCGWCVAGHGSVGHKRLSALQRRLPLPHKVTEAELSDTDTKTHTHSLSKHPHFYIVNEPRCSDVLHKENE